jgi:predicted RNase H-like HicB family nuclease
VARTYTAVIQFDAESGQYVGFIPALPGTHSCAETLDQLRDSLREAIELMLESLAEDGQPPAGDIEVLVEPIELPA